MKLLILQSLLNEWRNDTLKNDVFEMKEGTHFSTKYHSLIHSSENCFYCIATFFTAISYTFFFIANEKKLGDPCAKARFNSIRTP